MTAELTDQPTDSLYHRMLHATSELAKDPKHFAELRTVTEEAVSKAMAVVRQKVEGQRSESD
jgi:hypothetical protein